MKYVSLFIALIAALAILAVSVRWGSTESVLLAEDPPGVPAVIKDENVGTASPVHKTKEVKTSANGKITFVCKNITKSANSDLHFKVLSPENALISKADPAAPLGNVVGDDGAGNMNPAVGELELERPIGGNNVAAQGTQSVALTFVVPNPAFDNQQPVGPNNPKYLPYDSKKVKLKIWWTSGGDTVVAYSPNKVGNGALVSVAVDDYDANGVEIVDGTPDFVATPMVIAEAEYGQRFESGDLLIRLERSVLSFDDNGGTLAVSAIGEDGGAADPTKISFGPPRIDSAGNIVVAVTRDRADTEAVGIVISNAKVLGSDKLNVGEEIFISMRCSALQGSVLDEWQKIVTVTEELE